MKLVVFGADLAIRLGFSKNNQENGLESASAAVILPPPRMHSGEYQRISERRNE